MFIINAVFLRQKYIRDSHKWIS